MRRPGKTIKDMTCFLRSRAGLPNSNPPSFPSRAGTKTRSITRNMGSHLRRHSWIEEGLAPHIHLPTWCDRVSMLKKAQGPRYFIAPHMGRRLVSTLAQLVTMLGFAKHTTTTTTSGLSSGFLQFAI